MSPFLTDTSLAGPLPDPSHDAGYDSPPARKGFFTDTSICIGCKACEVACKEWNGVPHDVLGELSGNSYDNTMALGANAWRHVAFIEQKVERDRVDLGMPGFGPPATTPNADAGAAGNPDSGVRWLMSSDVCKHCTHAACLDVCPTGALFRTEFGTVVVQDDICNGCGYCVPACPYGVIDKREDDGRVFKCTLCYDRLSDGLEPACAKACPTDSIQFGDVEELRAKADQRVAELHARGELGARLYGHDPNDGVGGDGAFFLLMDEPEVYGLPPDPVVVTRDLVKEWAHMAVAALSVALTIGLSFRRQPSLKAGKR